jgi:hypothetical protein
MDEFGYHLEDSAINDLVMLMGATWDSVGTSNRIIGDLEAGDLLTCPALLITDQHSVALSIDDNEDLVGGDYETLTILKAVPIGESIKKARKQGTLFFHGKGERVRSIHLIREEVTQISNGTPTFQISSDSGVVIALESVVIRLQRRGLDGFDFLLAQAPSLDEVSFYRSDQGWPMSLTVTHEFRRDLIPLT